MMRITTALWLPMLAIAMVATALGQSADEILQQSKCSGGVVVVVGDGKGDFVERLVALAKKGPFVVCGLTQSRDKLAAARKQIKDTGLGGRVTIEMSLTNPSTDDAGALVDLRVHFVKANGSTSPKVFKGKELQLAPGESGAVRKTISVAQHSTRTHHPGTHVVDAIVNGATRPIGAFEVGD